MGAERSRTGAHRRAVGRAAPAHTDASERGRAYAAHFALTHLFWLVTYPGVGYMARYAGPANTFTLAGTSVVLLTGVSLVVGRGPHRHRTAPVA